VVLLSVLEARNKLAKLKPSEIEIDLSELERLVQFAVASFLAWITSGFVANILEFSRVGFFVVPTLQIIPFFVLLWVYYLLIKVILRLGR
jgi:hypothetical protein